MSVQREQLEADVLIVGAGPAGLSCALHLANLIKKYNESGAKPELSAENCFLPKDHRFVFLLLRRRFKTRATMLFR